uniref:Uncharacterized protein n=1 Tax=Rhipicephalus microplus TaxID=6941 RepID=A0A6G5A0P8_RHIMP
MWVQKLFVIWLIPPHFHSSKTRAVGLNGITACYLHLVTFSYFSMLFLCSILIISRLRLSTHICKAHYIQCNMFVGMTYK